MSDDEHVSRTDETSSGNAGYRRGQCCLIFQYSSEAIAARRPRKRRWIRLIWIANHSEYRAGKCRRIYTPSMRSLKSLDPARDPARGETRLPDCRANEIATTSDYVAFGQYPRWKWTDRRGKLLPFRCAIKAVGPLRRWCRNARGWNATERKCADGTKRERFCFYSCEEMRPEKSQ